MIELATHTIAAAFMIYWGCKITVDGAAAEYLILYLIMKVVPLIVGLIFAFNLYARFMGWPV